MFKARTRYMFENENNKVEWAAQQKRDAFWEPLIEAGANVFAFIMFLVYCSLIAAMVFLTGALLYAIAGGILSLFGIELPGRPT